MNRRMGSQKTAVILLAASFLLLSSARSGAEIFAPRSVELHDGGGGLVGRKSVSDSLAIETVVGDFNGDGYDDIAASENETEDFVFAGAVHVIYGGPDGPSTADDQIWTDFDPTTLFSDVEANDRFGWALAAGDFDGDGFDDLAIGIPNELRSAIVESGAVLVIYGSEVGLDIFSTPPPRRFALGSNGIGGTATSDDHLGTSLVAADFSGDGFADLAVGIPGMDSGATDSGGVLVVYGSASGLQTSNELILSQDYSTMPEVSESGDLFGYSLAAGDFDGDGNDDLAVGVPGEEGASATCTASDSGAVHVLYGDLGAGLILLGNQLWYEANVDTGGDCGAGDSWGATLAAGDLTGDLVDDLVVGAPLEDIPGVVDAGAITLLLGGTTGGIFTGASTLYDESDFPAAANPQTGDRFGGALAIGDFREDGMSDRLDLAIGIPSDNVWNGFSSVVNAGSVILAGGTLLDPAVARLWAPGLDGVAGSLVANQDFGGALAAGDFNGDGHGDLVVSIAGADVGEVDSGALHVAIGALFSDGFESDDTDAWSAVVP